MDKKIVRISVIILAGGDFDKKLYQKSLDSIRWADEIVKIDVLGKKMNFAEARNLGAKKAKGKWLLYLDTDEIISPALKNEIDLTIKDPKHFAYAISRQNILLGHLMHYGGWSPDFVVRLIRKDKLMGWHGELHEQPKFEGSVGYLNNSIIHHSHRSLAYMVEKTNKWSEIEARLLFESDHPPMNFFRFFSAGFREFWYRAILKLGFLDGKVGVIEIIYQVFSRLISYSKLWELQLRSKEKK